MNHKYLTPFVLGGLLLFPAAGGSAAEVPSRKEISIDSQWRLDHIYPTDAAWEEALAALPSQAEAVSAYQGKLGESAEAALAALQARDDLSQNLSKVFAYARMNLDTDATVGKYQEMQGKAQAALAQAGAAISFIEPELLALPPETLTSYQKNPLLNNYVVYFADLTRQKAHMLTPAEEKLLAATASLSTAPQNIFGALSNGDMKFPSITDEKGETLALSEGRFGSLVRSRDQKVRKDAFETLLKTYGEYRTTYAAILSASVKKDGFYATQRKYSSDLEAALDPNAIPQEVYTNLIHTVDQNLPLLHRYVDLKKKALGLSEIHLYDLYVPLLDDPFPPLAYEQGVATVEAGLAPLGEAYLADLKVGLNSGWIDRYENKGKRSGAYSWGIYGVHPFVLLNYQGKLDDTLTLAHEMGHAMHSYYSQKNQPYPTSDYTIFCAEVASTTNETLVLQHMLKNATTKEERIYLLNQMAESIRSTLYRQTLFAEFELYIHETVQAKGGITADEMEAKWVELYKKYYGAEIVIDDVVKSEWSRIPHFYTDFYVYQYATGISAALALADGIQTGGEPARDAYLNFLKSGSSADSITILKNAGVDMSSPEPIQKALDQFKWILDELEKELG